MESSSDGVVVVSHDRYLLENAANRVVELSRAYPQGSTEAATHLSLAVNVLRGAGRIDFLLRALLARRTPDDLAEVFRIATRSGMRLHLADYHLIVGNLEEAERLVSLTLSHERDAAEILANAASETKKPDRV